MNILANNQYEINRKKVVIASGGTLGVEWGGYADGGPYFDTDVILGSPSIYVDGVKQDLNKDYTFLEKRITWIGTPPEEGRRISGYSTNTSEADTKMSKVVFSEAEGNLSDGQTVFTFAYTPRYIDVMLNGIELIDGVDFTADNGDYLTLNTGLTLSDTLVIKVIGIFTVNDLYDKTEIDLKIGTETINQQKADKLITVGSGGDYVTINEALEEASKAYPLYKQGGYSVEIKLLAGFVMQEQVIVKGIDLGYITITGEDEETTIQRDTLTESTASEYDGVNRYSAFNAINATLPVIGQLFNMDASGEESTERSGIYAVAGSKVNVLSGCGVKNTGHYGILIYKQSEASIEGSVFSGVGSIGIYAVDSCSINATSADASNAGAYGIYANMGSTINARNNNASNAGTYGIYARSSSTINADTADASNAGTYGIYALYDSTINAISADASNAGNHGIVANSSSTINASSSDASGADTYGIYAVLASSINASSATITGAGSISIAVGGRSSISAVYSNCTSDGDYEYYSINGSTIDISSYKGDARTNLTLNEWGAGGSITN